MITGTDTDRIQTAARELDADGVVCDCADPTSLAAAQTRFPHHLDAVVLTVQTVAEHLRSGGSIVAVLPAAGDGGPDVAAAAAKAALSRWIAGQADHFGTRGITINAVAAGGTAPPGYDGLTGSPPSAAGEIARLAVFLSTPAARHITGQTLHVGRGAAVTYS